MFALLFDHEFPFESASRIRDIYKNNWHFVFFVYAICPLPVPCSIGFWREIGTVALGVNAQSLVFIFSFIYEFRLVDLFMF